MYSTERSLLNLKKETAQRTLVFGFKLLLLSSYLHVDGYKILSKFQSYTIIKPKQIYKPSPNTQGKTNKMQMNNTNMGKGDIVSVKFSLCCYYEEGAQGHGCFTCLAKRLSLPTSCWHHLIPSVFKGDDVTPLGLTHSVFCLSSGLCFFSLVRDNSNSGPRHPCHGKHNWIQVFALCGSVRR